MNGQYGIKGYLYQSMIAVLNSLAKEWDYIIVEPNTELDKVDIIWNLNGNTNVSQVKSSINNFSKNDILSWIINLRYDMPDAELYSIFMIGNSSGNVKSFFSSIEHKNQSDFPENFESLYDIREKIKVVFEPENITTLENALIAELDKFFHNKEISADYPAKKLIVGGMVNQITKLSTQGKKLSRQEFEDNLLDWITYNYSNQIRRKTSSLKLDFYLENIVEKKTSIEKIIFPKTNQIKFYTVKIGSLKKRYEEICKYNFETKSFEEKDIFGFIHHHSFAIDGLNGYENRQVLENEHKIKLVSDLCEKYLSKKPEREFFNFGNLKESKGKSFHILHPAKTTLDGTDSEIEKKKLYDNFFLELLELKSFIFLWKKLSKFSIIPIVLENTGDQFEENIKVQLLFPKSVKIYKAKNFPIPKDSQVLRDINDDSTLFFDLLKHKKSRTLLEYISPYKYPEFIELPTIFGANTSFLRSKYRRILDYYFDYEFYEDNDYKVVECSFKELNNKECVAFPSYLFVNSKTDIEIKYKITCKNNSSEITGKLEYKVCS